MPRKRKSQLPNLSYRLSLKWYQIEFPIIFNIICIFLSTLWFLDCKRNFSITFWLGYRTQYTLTFTVNGTNISRTFTNVSKTLSAINANIVNINTYFIEKGYTSTWWPLTVLIFFFENNSVTASCNIRYQIINELDILKFTLRLDYMLSSF